MDPIEIYNYLIKVKPFFRRYTEVESDDKEGGGDEGLKTYRITNPPFSVPVCGGAESTRHEVILIHSGGGIYKIKD